MNRSELPVGTSQEVWDSFCEAYDYGAITCETCGESLDFSEDSFEEARQRWNRHCRANHFELTGDVPTSTHFPGADRDGFGFRCPDCGETISSPYSGNIWECHTEYGGCGAVFKPVEAFKRVDDDDV